ncbi:AraC family transcriptional regulator [Chitinibacter sp. FCG-7]|uniref:AraC family transcriptional regulator n=1 Tax=Chitinibacter mangrovi TaxID=3153927 RepID=A0AAU7F637_9NEIS
MTDALISDYTRRLQQALEYIRANLDQDLSLAQLARLTHFSPYHFHRIFSAQLQETPADYVRRIRLEAAAQSLISLPLRSMSQIALECGFKSQALLARAFRAQFGISPSQWRQQQSWQYDGQFWSLLPPAERDTTAERAPELLAARQGIRPPSVMDVQLKQLPAYRWAYLWCNGADTEQLARIWASLREWAMLEWTEEQIRYLQGASRWSDDPSITPLAQRRYEAGLLIADTQQPGRQLAVRQLPAGQYVVLDFCGRWQEEAAAAEYLFNYWLPRSPWALDDRPHYCLSQPFLHESSDPETSELSTPAAARYQWCVPVRPARSGARRLYQLADFQS